MSSMTRKNAVLTAIAVTGIAVFANVAGLWLFARADLTRNSRYSLSETSKEAVRALPGLEVQVFISPNLPTSMIHQGREIQIKGFDRDLLDRLGEYQSWSSGGMRMSLVSGDVEEKAVKARLELFSFKDAEVSGGRLEFRKYALGAVFTYRNQVEVLPIVTDPDSLEFEITRILTRLADKYAKSRSVEPFLEAGRDIHGAAQDCVSKLDTLVRATDSSVPAMMGITRLSLRDRLVADLQGMSRDCSKIGSSLAAAADLSGRNEQMDALLRSGRLFSDAADQLLATLSGSSGRGQDGAVQVDGLVARLEELFRVVDVDASNLMNLPARKTVGFLCGSRQFCPFPEDGHLVARDIAQALVSRNPQTGPLLSGIEQIENQINVINNGLRQGMFENRGLSVVPVTGKLPLPDDVDALVVFGPELPLSETDRYLLDQFLVSGRTVIVFVNAWDLALFNIDENGDFSNSLPMAAPRLESRTSNLGSVLQPYGVRLRGDLVVGLKSYGNLTVSGPGERSQGKGSFAYPLLPFFDSLDRTHVLVRNMPGVTMPLATTIKIEAVPEGVEVTSLISTSPETAFVNSGLDVLPQRLVASLPSLKAQAPAPVAVALTGTFRSAFDEVPEGVSDRGHRHLAGGKGRLLVVGSSMGLENLSSEKIFAGFSLAKLTSGMVDPAAEMARYASRFQNWQMRLAQVSATVTQNMSFVYNCLDWGVMNDALVDIRSKSDDRRPINQLSPVVARVLELSFIIGLPLMFALAGLIRHRIRRNRPW